MQYPPLCGGVFFKALLGYRKSRVSHKKNYSGEDDPLADRRVLLALIKVTDPNFPTPKDSTLKANTSTFMNCRDNIPSTLPFESAGFVASFNGQMKNQYPLLLFRMQEFLDYLIGMDDSYKHEALIRDLLEIIENDPACCGKPMLIGAHGEVMVPQKDFFFVSFILGVWHHIISHSISNKLDNDLFDAWAASKSKGSTITREIRLTPQIISKPEPATVEEEPVEAEEIHEDEPQVEVYEAPFVNPQTGQQTLAQFHVEAHDNGIAAGVLYGGIHIDRRKKDD